MYSILPACLPTTLQPKLTDSLDLLNYLVLQETWVVFLHPTCSLLLTVAPTHLSLLLTQLTPGEVEEENGEGV